MDDLASALRKLRGRATVGGYLAWLYMAGGGLALLATLAAISGMRLDDSGMAVNYIVDIINLVHLVIFIASAITIGMWIHRAHSNLDLLGEYGREYTPGWAVGWFFVPFANLIKPYGAMRELWNSSMNAVDSFAGDGPPDVKLWWFCYLGGSILGNISAQIVLRSDSLRPPAFALGLDIASLVLSIAAAFLIKKLMDDITAAQTSRMSVGGTFD